MIALCSPVYDAPESEFLLSLWGLRIPGGSVHLGLGMRMLLDDARRELTKQALAIPEVTHTFWVDGDMEFAPDALENLLAQNKTLVGGLCFERRPPYNPTIFLNGAPWHDYPSNVLVRADSTGGAFLLIARQVYEDVGREFGSCSWWTSAPSPGESGKTVAGDESFMARARTCGHDLWIHTGVKTGHVGKNVINEDFYRRWRRGGE